MNPLDILKQYLLLIVGVGSFVAGLYIHHVWTGYKDSQLVKEVQAQLVKQDITNREEIKKLQADNISIENDYQDVKDKLNVLKSKKKVTNVPCKLTPDAVSVWNSSIESVPKDTTGTIETTTGASTTEIPIELVLDNKIENDKRFNLNKAQIDAIIRWEVDTYGK